MNTGLERLHRAINTQLGEIKALEAALYATQKQLTTLKARVVSVLDPFIMAFGELKPIQQGSKNYIHIELNACRAARDLRDELVNNLMPRTGERPAPVPTQPANVESSKGDSIPAQAPTPEPTCKHCGKVREAHYAHGRYCNSLHVGFSFQSSTPVPVAEPEVAAGEPTWPDCREVQCKQVHNYLDALLESLGIKYQKSAYSVSKAAAITLRIQSLKAQGLTAGSTSATGASWPCDNPLTDVPMDQQVIELNQANRKLAEENTRLRELLVGVREIHRSTPEGVAMKVPNSLATEIENALAVGGEK